MAINAKLADKYSSLSPIFKIIPLLVKAIVPNIIPLTYNDENFPEDLHGDILLAHDLSTFYGFGFPRFKDTA